MSDCQIIICDTGRQAGRTQRHEKGLTFIRVWDLSLVVGRRFFVHFDNIGIVPPNRGFHVGPIYIYSRITIDELRTTYVRMQQWTPIGPKEQKGARVLSRPSRQPPPILRPDRKRPRISDKPRRSTIRTTTDSRQEGEIRYIYISKGRKKTEGDG